MLNLFYSLTWDLQLVLDFFSVKLKRWMERLPNAVCQSTQPSRLPGLDQLDQFIHPCLLHKDLLSTGARQFNQYDSHDKGAFV